MTESVSAAKLTPATLAVVGVSKSFDLVQAVREVTLRFEAGRITALLGENGAGKSTLIRLCSGVMAPDAGEVLLNGNTVDWRSPIDAMNSGVQVVNQEPQIISEFSVANNIYLADLADRPGFARIEPRKVVQKARDLLSKLDLTGNVPSPDQGCQNLSPAERQMIDIARALSRDPRVLFLDEPNSSLTLEESERLFRVMLNMKNSGVAVVLVSHRLNEVYSIADHIIVLRDGQFIAEGPPNEIPQARAVALMAGRERQPHSQVIRQRHHKRKASIPVFEVKGLSGVGFEDVSFTIQSGEILGMAGLVGAGRSEIAAGVIGLTETRGGRVLLDGRPILPAGPRQAQRLGIQYLAEERRLELFYQQSMGFNIAARIFENLANGGLVGRGKLNEVARELAQRFGVKAASIDAPITSLSGGNQQKVLIARALATKPRLLILDEPTRGVDVGTKADIYLLLRELASTEGLAVWFISSEMEEVIELADRIVVIRHGKVVHDEPNTSDPKPVIAAAMTGQKA
jgi:ABC-type sugar transport system ATPase subunit